AMILVGINPPSWRRETTTTIENFTTMKENLVLLEEVREATHIREFTVKQRPNRRYDTRVIPRGLKEGDRGLRRPMERTKEEN
ncbi:hypothetical protein A2U01_0053422, partial [Trifolium medium]|nr:hypothetical protein [Trifolium medium]